MAKLIDPKIIDTELFLLFKDSFFSVLLTELVKNASHKLQSQQTASNTPRMLLASKGANCSLIASAKVLSEISRKVSKLDDVTVMDGTITDSNFKMSFSDEVSAAEGFLIEILAEIFFSVGSQF